MMTNLDDVLVDDIKSIGLNLNERSENSIKMTEASSRPYVPTPQ